MRREGSAWSRRNEGADGVGHVHHGEGGVGAKVAGVAALGDCVVENGDGVVGGTGGGLGLPADDAGEPGAAHVEAEVSVVGAHSLRRRPWRRRRVRSGSGRRRWGCRTVGASAPKTAMELGRLTLLTPLDHGSFQDVEVAGEVNGVCQGSVGLGEDGEQGAEVVYDGDAVVLDDVVNVFVAPGRRV